MLESQQPGATLEPSHNPMNVQAILDSCYRQHLQTDPTEHNLLVCQSFDQHMDSKASVSEIAFETFSVHGIGFALNNVLSLYSTGQLFGGVLDSGGSSTFFVPVYEGYPVTGFVESSKITGDYLTNFLNSLLEKQGIHLQRHFVEEIKKRCCNIADRTFNALIDVPKESFELPDQRTILVGKEMKKCPEAMFCPMLANVNTKTFPRMITDSIEKMNSLGKSNNSRMCMSNILLTGGNSLFPNLSERLHSELKSAHVCKDAEVNVSVHNEPLTSAWTGGAILACLSTFQDNFVISRDEYQEQGASAVYRKCV